MIERALAVFMASLNSSWADVQSLSEDVEQPGLLTDWAQASWETLVEASLQMRSPPIRLVIYGDGADCHPHSSRASFPSDLPTHALKCRPISDGVMDYLSGEAVPRGCYDFDRFVSAHNGWYFERPPFDHVLLERQGSEFVVKLSDVMWELSPVESRGGR